MQQFDTEIDKSRVRLARIHLFTYLPLAKSADANVRDNIRYLQQAYLRKYGYASNDTMTDHAMRTAMMYFQEMAGIPMTGMTINIAFKYIRRYILYIYICMCVCVCTRARVYVYTVLIAFKYYSVTVFVHK